MTDYTELKRLAEACGDLNWRAIQENWCEWAIRDDHGYIATLRTKSAKHPGPCPDREAKAKFLCAVTPATVLAMIAENERLKTLRSTTERDLAQELEVWRNGPSCWSCGDTGDVHDIVGEWRGQCDCNAAKLIDATAERDQLKAEIEALRKRIDDMSPFKGAPLAGQDTKCLACGGYHYGMGGLPCPNMRFTAQADLPETRSGQIGAAMVKGEQS
ncbi:MULTISPECIES: hypothetical protein [unclassified Pseudomonas]|uniref:hypothetical protein n=1 Tax=unclassified Pseudomonas TaxID=196821 RepID=UPI000C88BEE7|nr:MULTISPECIES: hypothetical protein [unclassified Pseudomonas]PMX22747.1 hypothetical protein C1Y23_19265 [Pseudomonas sp. GW460-12]PMX31779.1 hypothetical protein C1Y24_23585 [Pseudomonas sp. MPR-R2A4]PMX39020.1 hypothetical protein C1Y26_20210 [Pseudomonas sp. MPR-R2A7]PMX51773.1 hypothetical protein C1Y17_22350 [Pseudomonas sp. MPR-R2A6]PMX87109.1 hypothetical protein C1Y21_23460 [Pseudomonas sp. MPR-R2A3]